MADLEQALDLVIEEGERDPLSVARKVIDTHGEHWVLNQLRPHMLEIVAGMARKKIRPLKRTPAPVPIDLSRQLEQRTRVWIPGVGYKIISDLTAEDLRKKAEGFWRVEGIARRNRNLCLDLIEEMKKQGATRLGQLEGPLPPLSFNELPRAS